MTLIRNTLAGAAISLLGMAGAATAAPGIIAYPSDLRAGPGMNYPPVMPLPRGAPAEIFGCLSGWVWCDVGVEGQRGWVAGNSLQVFYDNRPALLPGYAPRIGLPIIGFDFGDYWGRYYRGRPWYADHDRWGGGRGQPRGPGPAEYGRGGPERGGPGRAVDRAGGPGDRRFDGPGGPGPRPGPERGGPERGGPERGGPERGGPGRGEEDRGPPPGH